MGNTYVAGVYQASTSMQLTGTVTLNGQGNPNAFFIFQAGSTLTTASNSNVVLRTVHRLATSIGRLAVPQCSARQLTSMARSLP